MQKVSREIADTIEYYQKNHGDFWIYHLMEDAVSADSEIGKQPHCRIVKSFAEMGGLDDLLQALVNGYEIEETPEEQAIQWLIKRKCLSPGFSEHDIVMAIKSILNKGVNDHE